MPQSKSTRHKHQHPSKAVVHSSSSSSDSSESESDDEITMFNVDVYNTLDIPSGLANRFAYPEACEELSQLFTDDLYARSFTKPAQGLVVEHILLAIEKYGTLASHQAALSGLMKSCTRHLKKSQAQIVSRAYKKKMMMVNRANNRRNTCLADEHVAGSSRAHSSNQWQQVAHDDYEDEEPAPPAEFAHLPLECIELVLQRLDPATLGRAACVCKEWWQCISGGQSLETPGNNRSMKDMFYNPSEEDPSSKLWHPLLRVTFKEYQCLDRTLNATTSYQLFCQLAMRNRAQLARWTAHRLWSKDSPWLLWNHNEFGDDDQGKKLAALQASKGLIPGSIGRRYVFVKRFHVGTLLLNIATSYSESDKEDKGDDAL